MSTGDAERIARNIASMRDVIAVAARRVGRDPEAVRLLAATKTVPVERLRMAIAAGMTLFGENRVQEALPKLEAFEPGLVEWHFIGRLQRLKVKSVVGRFAMIQSVESLELAEDIERRAERADLRQAVLLEVNIGGELSKGGFSPEEVPPALPELAQMPHVVVKGLMTIPPFHEDPERTRPVFRTMRELSRELQRVNMARMEFGELSMGMSRDVAVAVEEGATIVRIGTAIFGGRPFSDG